jgi:hypothetical protein
MIGFAGMATSVGRRIMTLIGTGRESEFSLIAPPN